MRESLNREGGLIRESFNREGGLLERILIERGTY